MKRIICLGNPFADGDLAGPLVFERLRSEGLPRDISLVDGGLAGLNLLRFFSGCSAVVLVDSLAGSARGGGGIALLSPERICRHAPDRYGHGSGLPFLLKMLPAAVEPVVPAVYILGVHQPHSRKRIRAAARLCLELLAGNPGGRRCPADRFAVEGAS